MDRRPLWALAGPRDASADKTAYSPELGRPYKPEEPARREAGREAQGAQARHQPGGSGRCQPRYVFVRIKPSWPLHILAEGGLGTGTRRHGMQVWFRC